MVIVFFQRHLFTIIDYCVWRAVRARPPASSSSPVFLEFNPTVENNKRMKLVVAQPLMEEEDYGMWSPTPYFDGGNGAPIPHAKFACCPHLPCCSHFQHNEKSLPN